MNCAQSNFAELNLVKSNWMKKDYQEFRDYLFEIAEEGYRDFALGGVITERALLGVRVPKCREIGKEIARGNYEEFLQFNPECFEEVMIRGFVIAGLPYTEMKTRLDDFIKLIDNWEICDTFVAALKSVKKNRDDFLNEIDKMLEKGEFYTRVALVSLLDHYLDAEYLSVVFDRTLRVKNREEYYVKMAVAWLVATCFAKYPEETMMFFKKAGLPKWTHNKAISKACESYRVDRDLKEELKRLRV